MMRLMLMRMGSASSVAGVAGVAGARGGARRAAEFVQRQVRQHTARSSLTIEDHLIGVAQNTLHSFEIHAPARDVGVLPIGVVNREEALRLTLRLVLEALLVGLGALHHPQRPAACARQAVCSVAGGLVARPVAVLLGAQQERKRPRLTSSH